MRAFVYDRDARKAGIGHLFLKDAHLYAPRSGGKVLLSIGAEGR